MKYRVYFEFFGRKMQTVVDANDENAVRGIIRNKIIFYSIKAEDDTFDRIMDIFGMKK
jgi:1-deoxy-D-xylulose 5-phosphate reductoisomerase